MHDPKPSSDVEKHCVLLSYGISSQSHQPNSIKWPKTSISLFLEKKLSLNQVATLKDFENRNVSNFGFNPFFSRIERFWAILGKKIFREKSSKNGTQVATLRGPKIKCLIFRFYCVFFCELNDSEQKTFFRKIFLDHSIGPFWGHIGSAAEKI